MSNLDFNFFCEGCDKSPEFCASKCFTNYRLRHFKKGDTIAYKGDLVRDLSVVSKGCVGVSIVLDSGVKLFPRYHDAPYPLGAVALFSPQNYYRVDVVAEEDCDVVSVDRATIEEHMALCRIFMRNFITYITSKLDIFADHITLLTYKSLRAKVAYYILSRAKGREYRFEKRVGDLADYFCVERPSLSRVISRLVEEGVITHSRGSGVILDAGALKNMLE